MPVRAVVTLFRWADVLKLTLDRLLEGKCFGWAAGLAYYFFLALFPALLFVVSLAGVLHLDQFLDRIVMMLSRVAPGDVVTIAHQQIAQITLRPRPGMLTLSLLATLWSGSSGMTAIMDSLNQAYQIQERRPWWRIRLTAVALLVALAVASLAAFSLVIAAPAAQWGVRGEGGLGPAISVLRWPLAFMLVVTGIGCVYQFAPDARSRTGWVSYGSATAATLWLLFSVALSEYVDHFAAYQKTYGAIGGVIIALLWFYFSSLALLIGAELDAAIRRPATRS